MRRDNCDLVDTWLDDWVAGRLPADLSARVAAHVDACERCHRLAAIVRDAHGTTGLREEPPSEAESDVVASVLDKTSGPACARAEELLPALVDRELEAPDREMVGRHVEHCSACARLLAALEESKGVLPSLAEIEPPLGFTARVLAHTSGAAQRSPLVEWWLRVVTGPRGGVELAYFGALLIVVLVGNPVSAFYDAEQHARLLVGAVPVERLAGQLPARQAAAGLASAAIGSVVNQVRAIGAEISKRVLQVKALADQAWNGVVTAANWVRTFDWRHVFTSTSHAPQPENKAPPK